MVDKFVCVRLINMRGVDLSQFQFDYDLTWAAVFLNSDGTVYARYGSRDERGPMSLNSIAGLLTTMQRVVEAHAGYPNNQDEFKAKRGPAPEFSKAEEIPAPTIRRALAATKSKESCIHCHNVYDGQHEVLIEAGTFDPREQTKYPLPANLGLELDVTEGTLVKNVKDDSPAAEAGFRPGDRLSRVHDQTVLSIADIQFALHHLATAKSVACIVSRGEAEIPLTLPLPTGWRLNNLAWRVSMYGMPPRPKLWVEALDERQRKQRRILPGKMALRIRGLFGKAVRAADLKVEDVIVGLDGIDENLVAAQFHSRIRMTHFKPGSTMKLKVMRGRQFLDVDVAF